MPWQDRIRMVKRTRLIQVRLLNGRTFISRCKRSMHVAIMPNIELNKKYKRRPALKNKCWWRPAVQQQGRGLGSIPKFTIKNCEKSTAEKT